jgi:hypothetical protein
VASGFHSAQYAANHYSQMNDYASTNVPLDNAQAYNTTSQKFCTAPHSLLESNSCQSNTSYMLPTISYYNSILDLHRHKTMEEQLDRTFNKDSPSSNADIDLILEKQREPIAGLIIKNVFVLPSKFQAKSKSDQAEGENERLITINCFFQLDLAISLILRKATTQQYILMLSSQEIRLMIRFNQP